MPDGAVFPEYSSTTVDEFLSSFHVINHMKTWTTLESTATATATAIATATTAVPDHYTSLHPFSASYKRILLEARPMGPSITDYNEFIPLIEELSTPDITTLGRLTSTDTAVVGQGRVMWDVKDFHGTRRSITTKAYLVPSGTIQLFSQ